MRSRYTAVVFSLAMLAGCGQDYNSNSGDNAVANLGLDCSTQGGQQLCAAALVFVNNHCFHCHSSWTDYKTDQLWKGSGLIIAGQPQQSLLIKKLTNSGGNMPLGLGAISSTDYATLKDWITSVP